MVTRVYSSKKKNALTQPEYECFLTPVDDIFSLLAIFFSLIKTLNESITASKQTITNSRKPCLWNRGQYKTYTIYFCRVGMDILLLYTTLWRSNEYIFWVKAAGNHGIYISYMFLKEEGNLHEIS